MADDHGLNPLNQLSMTVKHVHLGGMDDTDSTAFPIEPCTPMRVERVGPLIAKFNPRVRPAWGVALAGFIGQLTSANKHFKHRGPMGTINRHTIFEGDDVVVQGRPVTADKVAIYRSGIESILLNVFDLSSSTSTTAIHSESLPASQLCYTSLQLSAGWETDSVGYSFEHVLDGRDFLVGGHVYRLEYIFGRTTGSPIKHVLEIAVQGLLTPSSEIGI